jgi:uncharacterized protein YhfF
MERLWVAEASSMSDPMKAIRQRYPDAVTFTFGDSAELSARLIALVRSGEKTATCGALRDFRNGEPMPSPGRRDIVLDWAGRPALVVETIAVVVCRFDEVTEAMALAEGEDDSLDGWRAGHRRYFERNGGFSPDMEVVWERFALVEDLVELG